METVITVRRSLYGSVQTSFGHGQVPFINSALAPSVPQLLYGQQLQIQNAYICCMTNNGPMPDFDPSKGALGCTIYDSQNMDYWSQLIESGIAKSLSTQIYTPNTRTAVFSFSIDVLTDEPRTCYIHVSSEVKNLASARSITTTNEDLTSLGYTLFTIQKRDEGITSDAGKRVVSLIVLSIVFLVISIWELE
jgi:hypothetical protein